MVKRLSKAELAVQAKMLSLLEWGAKYPTRWHDIGRDEAACRAADLLVKRDAIEVRQPQNQFRLKR